MKLHLKNLSIIEEKKQLQAIPEGKKVINCINSHSFNIAQKDQKFSLALANSDYLIPDGVGIVMACRWLNALSKPKERITGWDLFSFEMEKLHSETENGVYQTHHNGEPVVMFVGSSNRVLELITKRMKQEHPHFKIITYSPPYKPLFSEEENHAIIEAINQAKPDLLWIGMTAPKQEKWLYQHWDKLNINCHVGCVGAVFDFYAGTIKRAPQWWLDHSLEWVYRLLKEPKRMWRRSVIGIPLFLYNISKEWIQRK